MGLPSLTLNPDLAAIWPRILEENGMRVYRDRVEGEQLAGKATSNSVSEVLWRVEAGNVGLQILEATYPDRHEGNVHLIFMPLKAVVEQQLYSRVQEVLLASGAIVGGKKERRHKKSHP